MGRLIQEVYIGFNAEVLIWPTKQLNSLTLEASATLIGELVLKAGKRMFSLYITDDTGEFTIEPPTCMLIPELFLSLKL